MRSTAIRMRPEEDVGRDTDKECTRNRAGRQRKGWYRYGDSNPGPVAENHVS
jgi:hypothetical protein